MSLAKKVLNKIYESDIDVSKWAVVQSGGVPLTSGEYRDSQGRRLIKVFDTESDAKSFANERNIDRLKSSSFTKRNIKYSVILSTLIEKV